MINQFKIDGLRFGMNLKKRKWKTHPNIEIVNQTNGKLRVLDTKEGNECLLIIPDGPNIIVHKLKS